MAPQPQDDIANDSKLTPADEMDQIPSNEEYLQMITKPNLAFEEALQEIFTKNGSQLFKTIIDIGNFVTLNWLSELTVNRGATELFSAILKEHRIHS
jgi:hypothetical protein